MPDAHANFAYSTVATAPSPATTGTSLVLQTGDGALMPTPPFNAIVCPANQAPKASNAEIVRVTSLAGDTPTIVRQQEGTSARTITVGDQFWCGMTKKTFTDIESGQQLPGTFAVRSAAAQAGSGGTWAKVSLNTKDYDVSSWFDAATNFRFQPTVAGYYHIDAGIASTAAAADGDTAIASIYKNGSPLASGGLGSSAVQAGAAAEGVQPTVGALVFLNGSTDYVELWAVCLTSAPAQSTKTFTGWMTGFLANQGPTPPGAGGQGIFGVHSSAAAQMGAAATSSKAPLNTIDYDLSGWFSTANNRFQPTVAGYYEITAGIAVTSAFAAGDSVYLNFFKNGTFMPNSAGAVAYHASTARGLNPEASVTVYLNGSTDYLEFWWAELTSAGAQQTVQATCWMTGHIVAPTQVSVPTPTYSDLQNGVLASGDCAVSGLSVAGGGNITFTIAAATPLWVTMASGVLIPLTFGGYGGTLVPGALPASGKYRGYGIEVDSNGVVTLSTGGSDQTTQALALANINTVPAAGKVRIADVIVLNTSGTYSLSASRDRRPWARGAYSRQPLTSGNLTTASTTFADLDATHLSARIECTGVPLRLRLIAAQTFNNGNNAELMSFEDGGAGLDGMAAPGAAVGPGQCPAILYSPTAGAGIAVGVSYTTVPTPGSHLFRPMWGVSGGTGTLTANASQPLTFEVEELVKASANNGTS